MEQLSTYDKILQYASDLLNALRDFLFKQLNIDLPMWLAQAVVLVLFLVILYLLIRMFMKAENQATKFATGVAGLVVATVCLMIVLTWVMYLRTPLSAQLEAQVTGVPSTLNVEDLQVSLLDFRGQSLGPQVRWLSGTDHHFLLMYEPEFADPPRLITVKGKGCQAQLRPRRNELTRGTVISLSLECGPSI